jgi:hypothetical protein
MADCLQKMDPRRLANTAVDWSAHRAAIYSEPERSKSEPPQVKNPVKQERNAIF